MCLNNCTYVRDEFIILKYIYTKLGLCVDY